MRLTPQFPTKSFRQQRGRLIRFGMVESEWMNARQIWAALSQKKKTDKRYSIEWEKV